MDEHVSQASAVTTHFCRRKMRKGTASSSTRRRTSAWPTSCSRRTSMWLTSRSWCGSTRLPRSPRRKRRRRKRRCAGALGGTGACVASAPPLGSDRVSLYFQKAENAEGQTPAIGPDGEVRNQGFLFVAIPALELRSVSSFNFFFFL